MCPTKHKHRSSGKHYHTDKCCNSTETAAAVAEKSGDWISELISGGSLKTWTLTLGIRLGFTAGRSLLSAFQNLLHENWIVKGPWIVKTAVGNYSACMLGKALSLSYHRGENYLETDVDIGSSAIANAILHLALGYVTSVTIDTGFVVEAQAEEELPEKLIGAVRICQIEMLSATVVQPPKMTVKRVARNSKVNHDGDDE